MKNNSLILVIILIVIGISIYYFESSKLKTIVTNQQETEESVEQAEERQSSYKDKLYQIAPELTEIAGYINTEKNIKISDFKGKVVLIDFWTYSCINCIRTLPYLTQWDAKYRDKGFIIIGVHTPEFEFEKDYNNVKTAVEKYNIKYPVVQDNNRGTWKAYNNRFWPIKYLIDADGYIRYDHIGEGAYEKTELKIQELLAEIGVDVSNIGTVKEESQYTLSEITPELYAGYDFALPRGQNIGNEGGFKKEQVSNYLFKNEIKDDIIYLEGHWLSKSDGLEFVGEEGLIILRFNAKSLNIVGNSKDKQNIEVFINGNYLKKEQEGYDVKFKDEKAIIEIDMPQLYNVFNSQYGNYELKLKVRKGFTFNSFTFG